MASGFPDWNISAKADIVAQSLGNLQVSIAEQLKSLEVTIADQLKNVEVSIAEQLISQLAVDIAGQSIGNVGVNIAQQDLTPVTTGLDTVPAESVEYIDASDTSTVASYSSVDVYIRPPAGYIYESIGFHLFCLNPPGATTGTHDFLVAPELTGCPIVMGSSLYSDYVEFRCNAWVKATDYAEPNDIAAQNIAARGVRFTETTGCDITYENFTDADQTNERTIWVVMRKIKIG